MLDVHPPHHPVHAWRDFFVHIVTIVIGLLIAVGLEQTVEFFHHHHQANEARDSIQRETTANISVYRKNVQRLAADQQQLARNLDLLNSGASDAEILPHLVYDWDIQKIDETAWEAAQINGSLALLPPDEIAYATYSYGSTNDLTPTVFAYFTAIETAAALVSHAGAAGKLAGAERQQLETLTESAMGLDNLISHIYSFHIQAIESKSLR
jgi:hypothetical protein